MDEQPELPVTLPAVTFLREVALEGQELHNELLYVGFSEKQATMIVAQMIVDAVNSRDEDEYTIEFVSSYDEDDLDDEDDNDYDGNSGI